jgi:hypothetical protein
MFNTLTGGCFIVVLVKIHKNCSLKMVSFTTGKLYLNECEINKPETYKNKFKYTFLLKREQTILR